MEVWIAFGLIAALMLAYAASKFLGSVDGPPTADGNENAVRAKPGGPVRNLRDPDHTKRLSAIQDLSTLGDEAAVEPLIEALTDTNWLVVRAAAIALGERGDPSASDALTELGRNPGRYVETDAAQTLRGFGYQLPPGASLPPEFGRSKRELELNDIREAAEDALRQIRAQAGRSGSEHI